MAQQQIHDVLIIGGGLVGASLALALDCAGVPATLVEATPAGAMPEVFDQRDEDGIVVLLAEEPDEKLIASVRKAAKLCPALAITIRES